MPFDRALFQSEDAMKEKARREYSPENVLGVDWVHFVKQVPLMNESELLHALNYENKHKQRDNYIFRLHRKYNQLRYAREQRQYGLQGHISKRLPYHRRDHARRRQPRREAIETG